MLDNIEIIPLTTLPKLERSERDDGYEFSDEYQNKLFSFEGKIIMFDKHLKHEIPIPLINIITQLISKDFATLEEIEPIISNSIRNIENKLNDHRSEFNKKLLEITEVFNKYNDTIKDLKSQIPESNESEINALQEQIFKLEATISGLSESKANLEQLNNEFKQTISNMVDSKLVDVHKNFQFIVNKLVNEEVQKIRDSIEINANKLKPTQIMLYREMGVTVEQIIELKKSNLI